jgi:hypothetical protein
MSNKVTKFEVFWRISAILTPIILPSFLRLGENLHIIIPGLWIACMGPIFLFPSLNDEDWEESAKPYKFIFDSTAKLFIGLLLISFLLYGGKSW